MQKLRINISVIAIFGFFLALSISGCSPIVKLEQSAVMDKTLLDSENTLGQTFVAHYDGLQGIELYLEPFESGDGEIILELWEDPQSPSALGVGNLAIDEISSPGFYNIIFPYIKESTQAYYYLVLQIEGAGSVNLGAAPGDVYYNGALYKNYQPQDSQLSFNLIYAPGPFLLGLLQEGMTWIGYLLVTVFLFVIPGWALLSLWYTKWLEQDWASKLALSTGVSLAIYPLLLLWTDVVDLHLGALYAWIPPILGIAIILWRNRYNLILGKIKHLSKPSIKWPDATLIAVFVMIFAIRFWVIRTFDAPIGSDSLHHTMAAQLILDNNGLMHSWKPYAELESFTYHFGFHTAVAVYSWITKGSVLNTILQVGQIFNGLAVLALFPLAIRIKKNSWGGVLAVLLAGLIFPMPMFYTNWGRYTQLTSQIILPAAIFFIWDILDSKNGNVRYFILTWLTMGGLALTHYRVLLFTPFFFPAFFLIKSGQLNLRNNIRKTLFLGLGSISLVIPWLVFTLSEKLSTMAIRILSTPANEVSQTTIALKNINIFNYLPAWAWVGFVISLGFSLWRRNHGIAIMGFWWFLVLLGANPSWFNLPGEGLISHGAVITGAYIPVSIVLGVSVINLLEKVTKKPIKFRKYMQAACSLCLISVACWGTLQRRLDIKPENIYVTRPDMRAAHWIQGNTAPNARFLVNSTTIFNADRWYIGTDAGWWLPILSKRLTTVSHMASLIEQSPPEFNDATTYLSQSVLSKGLLDETVIQQLKKHGVTYIFIGQKSNDILGVYLDILTNNENFSQVYHQDRVWVFEIQ